MKRAGAIFSLIALLMNQSCAHHEARQQLYQDALIPFYQNHTIHDLWDRWDEKSTDRYLVGGERVVFRGELPTVLEADPSTEVNENLVAYQNWKALSGVGVLLFDFGVILALIGYIGSDQGNPMLPYSTINLLWLTAGIGISFGLASHYLSESALDRALDQHNVRVSQSPLLSLSWKVDLK